MKFKLPLKLMIYFVPFIFCLGAVTAFEGVGILSAELSEDEGEFDFESEVVNYGEGVKANLTFGYEIVREEDGSLVFEESQEFSLAPTEVKTKEFGFELPEGMSDDEHVLVYQVLSTNEAPLAGGEIRDKSMRGDSRSIYLERGPYIEYAYESNNQRMIMETHGDTGENIKQDSEYDLIAELDGEYEDIKGDLWVNITRFTTYGGNVVESQRYPLKELMDEEGVISKSYLAEDPGTYRVKMSLIGDEGLVHFEDEVRAVISGEDVSIVGAENSQDVYSEGEIFDLSVELVGPADGIETFDEGVLELDILKNEELIYEDRMDLDPIGVSVEEESFEFTVPENLDEYRVVVRATKDGEVYDEIVLDYEELVPERVITEDGRVYDPNEEGCIDNGVCTPQEREYGGCYDCYMEDLEEEEEVEEEEVETERGIGAIWWAAISLVVIGIIGLGFFSLMRKKKEGER